MGECTYRSVPFHVLRLRVLTKKQKEEERKSQLNFFFFFFFLQCKSEGGARWRWKKRSVSLNTRSSPWPAARNTVPLDGFTCIPLEKLISLTALDPNLLSTYRLSTVCVCVLLNVLSLHCMLPHGNTKWFVWSVPLGQTKQTLQICLLPQRLCSQRQNLTFKRSKLSAINCKTKWDASLQFQLELIYCEWQTDDERINKKILQPLSPFHASQWYLWQVINIQPLHQLR